MNSGNMIYLDKNDDLKTVLACFKVNKISHIPIVSDSRVIGMVSKTDVVEYLYQVLPEREGEAFGSVAQSIKVKELMIQPVVEAEVNDSQAQILEKLSDHQVGSVILKKEGKVAGIVTEKDMVRYMAGNFDSSISFAEKVGLDIVEWLDQHGLLRVSRMLADIGI